MDENLRSRLDDNLGEELARIDCANGDDVLTAARRVAANVAQPSEREDLAQELALRAIAQTEGELKRGWFSVAGRRIQWDSLRKRSEESASSLQSQDEGSDLLQVVSGSFSEPSDVADYRELRSIVAAALRGLPKKKRKALRASLQRVSQKEVAAGLGVELYTVNNWIARARKELRQRVVDAGFSPPS